MPQPASQPTLFLLPTMTLGAALTGPAVVDEEAQAKARKAAKEAKKAEAKAAANEFILSKEDELDRVVRRAASKTTSKSHKVTR
jgi:hypothetical protein